MLSYLSIGVFHPYIVGLHDCKFSQNVLLCITYVSEMTLPLKDHSILYVKKKNVHIMQEKYFIHYVT